MYSRSAPKEAAVGDAVAKAMRRPVKTVLDEIKAARSFESRLGYV